MRLVLMGTSAFAVPALCRLAVEGYEVAAVVTQPDRPAGRGRGLTMPVVKQAALDLGVPVWQPETMRSTDAVVHLRSLAPEVVVVAAYGQILPRAVLEVPPLGCLNLHASLLPKLRGASPIAFAILEGHTETGVTVMQMDAGMDTGPVLTQRVVPIRAEDTAESLDDTLAAVGADLLAETLPKWIGGEVVPQSQDHSQATYTRIIRKDDGRIDWSQSAERIWRAVRAYHPWPGAFTSWDGKRLKVLGSLPLVAATSTMSPGTVVRLSDQRSPLAVVTGAGLLLLMCIQLEGKRPMGGDEMRHGYPGLVGAQLGRT